jgi:hypothetical protein
MGVMVAWGLALVACGGQPKPFSEYASAQLPNDVHWVISPKALHTTLSDLGRAHFIESDKTGKIVRRQGFIGKPDISTQSCSAFAALLQTGKDPLGDASLAALTAAPNLSREEIKALNTDQIGSFKPVNTQALWFLSERLTLQLDSSIKATVLSGKNTTGAKKNQTTLIATNVTLRFTPNTLFIDCLKDGYRKNPELWQNFSKFKQDADKGGNSSKVVIYTDALIGGLTGLTLGEVEFKSDTDFSSGVIGDAKFTANFSSGNVSISVQQVGILDGKFNTDDLFTLLGKRKAIEALNYLRDHTQRMAVIAVIPQELQPAPPPNTQTSP